MKFRAIILLLLFATSAMADPTSFTAALEAASAGTPANSDVFPFVDITATATKKITLANLRAALMPVALGIDVSGNLGVSHLNSGTSASSTTFWCGDGTWKTPAGSGGGTVNSVALTMPTGFTVGGSPVTDSGTLAVTLANQNAHLVLIGPTSGSAATPTFRALTAADVASFTSPYDPTGVSITNGSATLSNLSCGNVTLTGGTISGTTVNARVVTLTPGSSVVTDASAGDQFNLSATGNCTLSATNGAPGMRRAWRVKPNGHTISLDDASLHVISGVTLSWSGSSYNYLFGDWNEETSRFDILSFVPGL